MLNIRDATDLARALDSPIDMKLKRLVVLRRDQLLADTGGEYELGELAHWIIVMAGDTLSAVETALSYPILPDPPWEWVLDHDRIFEAPIILSDDGFGVVLIVPDEPGVDPVLLSMLRRDAQRAESVKD